MASHANSDAIFEIRGSRKYERELGPGFASLSFEKQDLLRRSMQIQDSKNGIGWRRMQIPRPYSYSAGRETLNGSSSQDLLR